MTLFTESTRTIHIDTITDEHVFAYDYSYCSTSTLEHTLILLKCTVNEHVLMSLVPLSKHFNPH